MYWDAFIVFVLSITSLWGIAVAWIRNDYLIQQPGTQATLNVNANIIAWKQHNTGSSSYLSSI